MISSIFSAPSGYSRHISCCCSCKQFYFKLITELRSPIIHHMKYIYLLLLLTAILTVNAQTILFPLKASGDKKYLVDQSGKPVFLNGCATWHLPFSLSYVEAKQFLLDLKAKNFNTVMMHIIPFSKQLINDNEKEPAGIPAFADDDISK